VGPESRVHSDRRTRPRPRAGGRREYRYYRRSTRGKQGTDVCAAGPLPAQAIEDFVVESVCAALADGTLAAGITPMLKVNLADQPRLWMGWS